MRGYPFCDEGEEDSRTAAAHSGHFFTNGAKNAESLFYYISVKYTLVCLNEANEKFKIN